MNEKEILERYQHLIGQEMPSTEAGRLSAAILVLAEVIARKMV